MKLTSMQKMLAAIALMVIVAVAVVLMLIVPKFSELSALDAEMQAANDQVAQTKALLAQLEQAKAGASLTQAELIALANQFPEKPELPALVIELQDVSNSSGLRFERIGPSVPALSPSGQYSEIALNARVTGEWADIVDYLRRVNRMTRAIRVTDVSIAPKGSVSPTSTEAPDVTADISMRAYVMNANAPAAGQ